MALPRSSMRLLSARRGFTLLELLIVILIMLTVTALTIPVIAPALQGRQVREGARILSAFLNAARNRAIESGRPAGVWIERLPGLREAAVTVHFAEIPPAYGGDFLDSSVETFVVNGAPAASGTMTGAFFNWPRLENSCRDYWNIVVPRSRTTMNVDSWASPDPNDQSIVREGDLIEIEGSDRRIPLKTVSMIIPGATSSNANNLWWYIYRGRNCLTTAGPDGTYLPGDRNRHWSGEFIINWFDRSHYVHSDSIRTTTWIPFNPNVTGLKYKIFRQPIKMQAGSVKMPDGVVIDLNFSSMTDGTTGNSGWPFHPRRDPGDKANTASAYWGDPIYPQDETPIVLVFSSGGHLERIYCRIKDGNTATAQWGWQGVEPYGQIHFLVGRLDRIIPHEQYYMSQDPVTNLAVQVKKNWLDLDNIWVNVSVQSGFISTAVMDNVDISGTYAANAVNPQNVRIVRTKAREGRVYGGR